MESPSVRPFDRQARLQRRGVSDSPVPRMSFAVADCSGCPDTVISPRSLQRRTVPSVFPVSMVYLGYLGYSSYFGPFVFLFHFPFPWLFRYSRHGNGREILLIMGFSRPILRLSLANVLCKDERHTGERMHSTHASPARVTAGAHKPSKSLGWRSIFL